MWVAAFYRFTSFTEEELGPLRERLETLAAGADLKGTLLLAPEGVNGSLSGSRKQLNTFLSAMGNDSRLVDLDVKTSWCPDHAFHRLKVRIKREIVSLGRPEVNPNAAVGIYVAPREWDALIQDPGTLVIDTRNDYEVALGSFAAAIDPGTRHFRDFPDWVERHLTPALEHTPPERRPQRLALFCTGGIRCEKATSYLLRKGFQGVHHLRGGILRYLEQIAVEQIAVEQSSWRGECFVFDQRVALNHRLQPGEHSLCHGCRMPLSPEDRTLASYVEGVSCRHCHSSRNDQDRERLRERQRQILLAQGRGEVHIGRRFIPTRSEADRPSRR